MVRAACDSTPSGRLEKRSDFLPARRPEARNQAECPRYPGSGARSSAKIDGAGFSFRKGDRHSMSHAELTERVRGIIAAAQHLPKEKITGDSTFEELGIDSLDGINI